MSSALNAGIAFAAGVASFVSPCILPLIPAYLSLMGGSAAAAPAAGSAAPPAGPAAPPAGAGASSAGFAGPPFRRHGWRKARASTDGPASARRHGWRKARASTDGPASARRWTAVRNTLFFVAGFAIVFVALGVLFSSAFGLLGGAQVVNVVAGAVIVLLGVNFLFDLFGFLNFERRLHTNTRPAGIGSSLLFGMAFGAGWTPCIGPILSSILLLAGSSGSVAQGAALLLVYSAGLGLPFILTSLFLSAALAQLARVRRHMRGIKIASGLFLIGIGLLVLAGRLREFNGFLFGLSSALTQWSAGHEALARLLFGGLCVALALVVAWLYVRAIRLERTPVAAADRPSLAASAATGGVADPAPGAGGAADVYLAAGAARREVSGRDEVSDAAPSTDAHRPLRAIRPVRLALFVMLAALGVLALAGAIDLPSIIASWLDFQGI